METKKKPRRKLSWDYLMEKTKLKPKPKPQPAAILSLASKTILEYGGDWYTNMVNRVKYSSVHDLSYARTGTESGYSSGEGDTPCNLWADMSEEHITECKIAFSYFDKNGTGQVTWKDFGKILRNLGQNPTEKDLEDVRIDRILQSGTNGTGSIDFPEFITIIAKRFGIDGIDEMENAFRAFDRNGDGLISFAEFKSYNEKIGQFLSDEEINEIIKEVDLDGDGYLNYEEFLKMNR